MKKVLIILCFCSVGHLQAQFKLDYNWLFNGYFAYKRDTLQLFSFNNKQVAYGAKAREMYLANSSISDRNGELLFYSNGCQIFNNLHNVILDGDSINYGTLAENAMWQNACVQNLGYSVGPQSILFLPNPAAPDTSYYMVYIFGKYLYVPISQGYIPFATRLQYAKIDRKNGSWVVSEKNKALFSDTLSYGSLTACKHSDNESWWIVLAKDIDYAPNHYYITLLTKNGFEPYKTQIIGEKGGGGVGAQNNFSPDGRKYATFNWTHSTCSLFDFNRNMGLLSNYRVFDVGDTLTIGGCAFSPNSRLLYVGAADKLYQFDTEAPDIAASKTLVAECIRTDGKKCTFFQMQQGPDCKIYIRNDGFYKYLGVINRPNEKGASCDVQQNVIAFQYSSFSMPNIPNYRLGTPYVNACDTITATGEPLYFFAPMASLSPNPTTDVLTIRIFGLQDWQEGKLELLDTQGNTVSHFDIYPYQEEQTLSIEHLPSGLYFYSLFLGKYGQQSGKIVKM